MCSNVEHIKFVSGYFDGFYVYIRCHSHKSYNITLQLLTAHIAVAFRWKKTQKNVYIFKYYTI